MNNEENQSGVQVLPVSVMTSKGVRIHAIQTGFVAVKKAHRMLSGPAAAGGESWSLCGYEQGDGKILEILGGY
jgi:hypothetical protein